MCVGRKLAANEGRRVLASDVLAASSVLAASNVLLLAAVR